MPKSHFAARPRGARWAALLVFAALFLAGAVLVTAQEKALRQTIEDRYEVLPVSGGLLLRPTSERLGVRTVELKGSEVSVNGERVSAGVLRAWLGSEAQPILDLAALSPAERSSLFELSAAAQPPNRESGAATAAATPPEVPTAPAEVPGVAQPPAVPEDSSSTETVVEGGDGDESATEARSRIGTILRFGGSATVEKNELAEEVVTLGGPIRVFGQVERDVTAIGSSVTVDGKVGGAVTSVGGMVHLGPNAEVSGDVTSVGGKIDRDPEAKVEGRLSETSSGRGGPTIRFDGDDFSFSPWGSPLHRMGEFIWSIISFGILALLVALVVTLVREPVDRLDAKLVAEPWQCVIAGIASQLLFFPLLLATVIVLAISIIGIPLLILIPFAMIALVLAAFLGFSAVSYRVGRLIERRFDRPHGGAVSASLLGVLALASFDLIGQVLGFGGGPLRFFSVMFWGLGFLLLYVAATVGFGAVVLTRFGLGPRRSATGTVASESAALDLDTLPPLPETPDSPKAHETQTED